MDDPHPWLGISAIRRVISVPVDGDLEHFTFIPGYETRVDEAAKDALAAVGGSVMWTYAPRESGW